MIGSLTPITFWGRLGAVPEFFLVAVVREKCPFLPFAFSESLGFGVGWITHVVLLRVVIPGLIAFGNKGGKQGLNAPITKPPCPGAAFFPTYVSFT